jgi:hypothetical protein
LNALFLIFTKMSIGIAHNVLAVYDVNGGTKGLAKQDRRRLCAGMRRGKERSD